MPDILISIVIPSFNRTGHLQNLVNSIAHQSVQPLEVLIIDQNDFDLVQATGIGNNDPLITIFKQGTPNVSKARNFGALQAKGDYIFFLDDDIVLNDTEFLRKTKAFLIQFPHIKCFCPYIMQNDFDRPRLFYDYSNNFPEGKPENDSPVRIKETASLAVLFEKSYFRASGGFDPYLFDFAGTSEDQELFFRMYDLGMPVYAFAGLVVYHDHEAAGGCELRVADYWKTRKKCTRSWVYMKWINNRYRARLKMKDIIDLMRSSFLNGSLFAGNIRSALRNIKLLNEAIKEGKLYFNRYRRHYNRNKIDHLIPEH